MQKIICLFVVALGGCATIVDGGPDTINIMTSDGGPAPARVMSKAGVQQVWLPTVISVPKSCSDISINLREDDYIYSSSAVIQSSVNPWVFGNIIFGGLLGLAIDAVAGNVCTYDTNVVVPVYSKYR